MCIYNEQYILDFLSNQIYEFSCIYPHKLIFLLIHSSELREHLIKVYDTRHVQRKQQKKC